MAVICGLGARRVARARMRPLLQPGNSVTTVWRARLDEHLGTCAIEGTAAARRGSACCRHLAHAVYGVTHLGSLVRLLPGRDPHEDIYEILDRTLDDFDDAGDAAAHLIHGSNSRCWPNWALVSILKTALPPAPLLT